MTAEELSLFPPLPGSVAEWEDLLVRLEIMPRALRANLEDARSDSGALEAVLRDLVEREAAVGLWLERAVTPGEAAKTASVPGGEAQGLRELSERFAGLRARNFAMVQRRGVQIWEWSAETGGGGRPTIHQVLGWLAGSDARTLASVRSARAALAQEVRGC